MQGSFALLFGAFLVGSAVILYFMLNAIGRRDMNPWRNERITESMRHRGRLVICGIVAGAGVYIAVIFGTDIDDASAEYFEFPLFLMAVGVIWLTFRQEIAILQLQVIPRRFATGEDPVGGLRKLGSVFAGGMITLGLLLAVLVGFQTTR
jgi:hypothetical protein